jgi:hypothetical protein
MRATTAGDGDSLGLDVQRRADFIRRAFPRRRERVELHTHVVPERVRVGMTTPSAPAGPATLALQREPANLLLSFRFLLSGSFESGFPSERPSGLHSHRLSLAGGDAQWHSGPAFASDRTRSSPFSEWAAWGRSTVPGIPASDATWP